MSYCVYICIFSYASYIHRKLNTAELEITVLENPLIQLSNMYSNKSCRTIETSGHFLPTKATATQVLSLLLPQIKLKANFDWMITAISLCS